MDIHQQTGKLRRLSKMKNFENIAFRRLGIIICAFIIISLISPVAIAEDDVGAQRFSTTLEFAQTGPILVQREDLVIAGSDLEGFLGTMPRELRWGFTQDQTRLGRAIENLLLQQALFQEAVDVGYSQSEELRADLHHAIRTEIARSYLFHLAESEELDSYEQQARELYLQNPEAYRLPETWSFRHVLLKVDTPDDEIDAFQRILAQHERVRSGDVTMEEVALSSSEDETVQENSGLIAGVQLSQLDPQFAQALQSLAVGEISPPVRSGFGWHIIQLESRDEGQVPEFAQIRSELEADLRKKHRDRVIERYARALFQKGGNLKTAALEEFLADYFDGS